MKIATDTLIGAACALVLGLLLGWAGRGLLTFPTNSATDTVYKNWRLICAAPSQKDAACQMSEDIPNPDSPQSEIARIVVGKNKDKLVMGVTVPLGVTLDSGISLTFGATQSKYYNYTTCVQVGCLAMLPLDDKLLDAMRMAKNATLIFSGPDGKAKNVPFDMADFAAAQRAYNHNESRRKSWFWRMWS